MPQPPVLYSFRRCPYAMRARLAIAASGQRCELREVVLRDKPQALIQASPKATVPVLVLPDGSVLEQSLDIMLWALRQNDPRNWLMPEGEDLAAMLDLIHECDERFKPKLDRYKYPQRFVQEFLQQTNGGIALGAGAGEVGEVAPAVPKGIAGAESEQAADMHAQYDEAALSDWAAQCRDAAGQWLGTLDARLKKQRYLFGSHAALADMAIAPFVRQYAHVNREWFEAQAWPGLQAWLHAWMESDLFARVMAKYRPWAPEASGEVFP